MKMKTENNEKIGNDILAKFMGGFIISSKSNTWSVPKKIPIIEFELAQLGHFKYHKSWTWLYPVIDKIESLGYNVIISRRGIQITKWTNNNHFDATDLIIDEDFLDDYTGLTKLTAVWDCCVSFVQWFNKKPCGISELQLLNFEGPVLLAIKSTTIDIFLILDEWKILVETLTKLQLLEFLDGTREITDSNNRTWNYLNESIDAKAKKIDIDLFFSE